MDPLSVEAFEARTAAAEARLAAIEAHLAAGGKDWKPTPAAKSVTGSLSPELVAQLVELKQLLVAAKQESDVLKTERDEALKAQEALKVENSKLQYRVKHLVRAVKEVDEAKAAVPNGPAAN